METNKKVENGKAERKQKMSISVAVRSINENSWKLKEEGLLSEEEYKQIGKAMETVIKNWMTKR